MVLALVALAGLVAAGPAMASGEIRVALLENASVVEVGGGPIAVFDLAGRRLLQETPAWLRVVEWTGGVELRGSRLVRARGVRLGSASGAGIRVGSREYRGKIEITRNGSGLVVVNELPLEAYLTGVLRAEVGDRMPPELLKAQAIVARTYAAYHRRLNAAKAYHVVATTAHQQYGGTVPADSPVWTAVRETEGQVLLWEGALFPAFYHTDSGGHTEDPRAVFAARNMPALRPIRVEFPSDSPHYRWSLDMGLDEITALLRKGGVSVDGIVGLEVIERSASLRVARIAVHGAQGSTVLRGNDFRRLLGYDTLKSTLFAVAVDGAVARFAGRGYGHGVGLDQSSAKTMAELGYVSQQILEYYYPGAAISSLR